MTTVTATPAQRWTNPAGKPKRFFPVLDHLQKGGAQAVSAAVLLSILGQKDTDYNRRTLRAATDYYLIERGIFICASDDGYFIAESSEELRKAARRKELTAQGILHSASRLRSLADSMETRKGDATFRLRP
jgi:hypothetical protein